MWFPSESLFRQRSSVSVRLMALHETTYAFSEIERAQLSTLAGLTSLALAGCVSSSRTYVLA
jgi:hypothetical protein